MYNSIRLFKVQLGFFIRIFQIGFSSIMAIDYSCSSSVAPSIVLPSLSHHLYLMQLKLQQFHYQQSQLHLRSILLHQRLHLRSIFLHQRLQCQCRPRNFQLQLELILDGPSMNLDQLVFLHLEVHLNQQQATRSTCMQCRQRNFQCLSR